MTRGSLQQRLTMLTVGAAVIAVVILTLVVARRDRMLLIEQNERLSRHLTETLAISITNALLYEELELLEEGGLIENYIEEWMRKPDLHVRYIHVYDRRGRVIASSDLRAYGRRPADSVTVRMLKSMETRTRRRSGEGGAGAPLLDVTTPLNISTRSWGHLRVGYSLEPLHSTLNRVYRDSIMLAVPVLALLGVSIWWLTRRSLMPLEELRETVALVPEQSWVRMPEERRGEVGELARAFNQMLDELEQVREHERETQEKFHHAERVAVVGKLAAGVAHEVRNPLAGIANLVENLERYKFNEDKFRQYTEAIRSGLARIERTVAGLVSLGQQTPFAPREVHAEDVFRETLDLVGYELRRHGIEAEIDVAGDTPPLWGDPDQVRQMVLNIVLNAVQAMSEEGGRLRLRGAPGEDDRVDVYIDDTGVGIPKEHLEKIFDPFFTTQPVGYGTGLGLAVTRSIVQRHGGTIRVQSTPGRGTSFHLTFRTRPPAGSPDGEETR